MTSQSTDEDWRVRLVEPVVTQRPAHPVAPEDRREAAIREFCADLADLLVNKQRAYGPDAITKAPGGPINGLRVRIFDKHARFQNLTANGDDWYDFEAAHDTALDLAGYGVIASLVLRDDW